MEHTRLLTTEEHILARLKYIRTKKQEYFVCLSLNSKHEVIARRTVTIGLVDTALTHPRETFAAPIKDRAIAVIIAHNHPSGDPTPSQEDIKATQQLVAAAQLLGIRLQDHIIVTRNSSYSFRGHGIL